MISDWYAETVSLELIEQRCLEYYEKCNEKCDSGEPNFKSRKEEADISIFISSNLYDDFQRVLMLTYMGRYNQGGIQVLSFMSIIGQLCISRTTEHSNLVFVGTEADLNRLVWHEIDKEFEHTVLGSAIP